MSPAPQKSVANPLSTLAEEATASSPENQPSAGDGRTYEGESTQGMCVDSPPPAQVIRKGSPDLVDKRRGGGQVEQPMLRQSPSSQDVFQYDLSDPSSIPYHVATMNVDPKDIPNLAMRRALGNGVSPHVMKRMLPRPLQLGGVQQSPVASPASPRSLINMPQSPRSLINVAQSPRSVINAAQSPRSVINVPLNPFRIWNTGRTPTASPVLLRSGLGSPVIRHQPRSVLRRQFSQPLSHDQVASSPHRKISNKSLVIILEDDRGNSPMRLIERVAGGSILLEQLMMVRNRLRERSITELREHSIAGLNERFVDYALEFGKNAGELGK
ncbi:uncharacterized protein [Panulirus ornatus]|uniref:uncharacterized protein n=1 Tax=Panulirus ornatus TaxID=150431 RepID=UPI003A86233D